MPTSPISGPGGGGSPFDSLEVTNDGLGSANFFVVGTSLEQALQVTDDGLGNLAQTLVGGGTDNQLTLQAGIGAQVYSLERLTLRTALLRVAEAVAAPADAALDASQFALWLDATNGVGNTKLMVKAKSADGTVKTAAILLA